MPESAHGKLYEGAAIEPPTRVTPCDLPYAELDVTTNFSFLRGASHPDEMVYQAALLGYRAMAVTDVNSMAGVARAHEAAKKVEGFRLVVGTRLVFGGGESVASGPWSVDSANGGPPNSGPAVAFERHAPRPAEPTDHGPRTTDLVCDVLVWPSDRDAYARLCRLLTLGRRRAPKGECHLTLEDFLSCAAGEGGAGGSGEWRGWGGWGGWGAVCLPADPDAADIEQIGQLKNVLGGRLSLAVSALLDGRDAWRMEAAADLSKRIGVPLLATNHVHYHDPSRRRLQDVLTCTRHRCTIHEAGYRLFPNAERYLKSPAQMHRLFAGMPRVIHRGLEVAEACRFSLSDLKYEYPTEAVPPGADPSTHLRRLTYEGARQRYPTGIPEKVTALIEKELAFISGSKYESYFLTVHDLVREAVSRGILCQGRGSAANSAVCYCLGVTAVDPARFQLVFERFASEARSEPPDIDIDFEHERREEIIQYVYEKYGRDHAGMTASLITYRGRSAVRDVGRALGLGGDLIDQLADKLDWWHRGTLTSGHLQEAGIDPADPTIRTLLDLTAQLLGFPRHLSQHVGGMVISRSPLCELVPIENCSMDGRTVIEWDKDDLDVIGLFKVDLLALGMLTAISKALRYINAERRVNSQWSVARGQWVWRTSAACRLNGPISPEARVRRIHGPPTTDHGLPVPSALHLHTIPPEDPQTYDMICRADTVGVFQIESRAQMSMLPRLQPREFYDLVIEVAIVRPGPIQGDMVHPYLLRRERKRRNPDYRIVFPKPELEEVLAKTLGVPLFQEQAMRMAVVAAGFTGAEADSLRRAMAAWKRSGGLNRFEGKFINGMLDRGYERQFAERCFKQISGFGEYGFPESHAASFANLVYASAWIKRHHPAAFLAALLNSQPMGFYAPAQLVRDAREHGVTVLPVDVNFSEWDCILVPPPAAPQPAPPAPSGRQAPSTWGSGTTVRLGFRMIKGMRADDAARIVRAREGGGGVSVQDLRHRARLDDGAVRRLANADALGSLNLSRRQGLWEAMEESGAAWAEGVGGGGGDMDGGEGSGGSGGVPRELPVLPLRQEVIADYAATGLSLKQHPVSFVRERLVRAGVSPAASLRDAKLMKHGQPVKVAGLVLVRQRPGTASGVVFITLEDETGVANLILWSSVYERYRLAARHATLLMVEGEVQRDGGGGGDGGDGAEGGGSGVDGVGGVVHVLVDRATDLTAWLNGGRDGAGDASGEIPSTSRDFH